MLQLLGAVLIVLATSMLGFRIAATYRDRPRQIRQLSKSLSQLQAEIEFHATPLPEALGRVGAQTSDPVRGLYTSVQSQLNQGNVRVREAFAEAVDVLERESSLARGDGEAVLLIAETLSTMDREHLHTQFDLALQNLRQLETTARENGTQSAKLFQSLGILTGVMLVILLY